MARQSFEQRMTAARTRRIQRFDTRITWLQENIERIARMNMRQRLQLAGQLLRDRVVINISRPVTKTRRVGGRGGGSRIVVTNRSRPGEFPKADMTRLMKDVFFRFEDEETVVVGVSLDYGLILETRMDRSFLVRTLNELRPAIIRILTGGA